ncbi:hypothetical protein GWK47_002708 [Chionoecetes opilio]|uniref:Uncharacterized protein n=1 Tax=Chionoecetes opilio TaxID=41210 RepID=A0A8J4XLB9_CHIOP|nr:hypothetical protein GWK47_002708 [Chionoecetes opilio]
MEELKKYYEEIAWEEMKGVTDVQVKYNIFLSIYEARRGRRILPAVTTVAVKILLHLAFHECYLLNSDYQADGENITEVRLQKGRPAWSSKVFDLSAPRLPKHYSRPLALKKENVRDLQDLLDLMPVNKQTFYNYIIHAHTVGLTEDVRPDQDPDDLDQLLEYQ